MTETDAWVGLRVHYPLTDVLATSAADVQVGPWVHSWRESMCRSLQWVKRGKSNSDRFNATLTVTGTGGNKEMLAGSFNPFHATSR